MNITTQFTFQHTMLKTLPYYQPKSFLIKACNTYLCFNNNAPRKVHLNLEESMPFTIGFVQTHNREVEMWNYISLIT
jgi:hypothetical protein